MILTSNLSWTAHIQSTVRAAKRQLGLLYRRFFLATPQARNHIYRSSILPRLEYCSAVWDPHQLTLIKELESVQKFAGRIITSLWRQDYSTILQTLGWEPLRVRRKRQKLKLCYLILNNHSCIPRSTFTPHPHPSPRLHHNQALLSPFVPTLAHKSSFFIDVIPLWNILPASIINAPSPSSFKCKLKTFPLPTLFYT